MGQRTQRTRNVERIDRQGADSSRWVRTLRKAATEPKIRLICLPYAAGGTGLFRTWADGLGDEVELLSVVLPGHGSRIHEPPYESWAPLLGDAFTALAPYLDEPHAFYGHSFGGRLAYELAQLTATLRPGRTRHLFVSGCRHPGHPQALPYLHQLSDGAFLDALRTGYGVPEEVLRDEDLVRLKLPALRADVRLAELWRDWHPRRLTVPVTAISGRDDLIDNRASMRGWCDYTEADCELVEVPGGHFLTETHGRRLLEIITLRLAVGRAAVA